MFNGVAERPHRVVNGSLREITRRWDVLSRIPLFMG
jgi:hypothetical protein